MNLPDLRILSLENLLPHEHTDPRRVNPLIERLKGESMLRNPPIVAPLGPSDPRFVVLDGANRTAAFHALGMPHILAQVVSYAQVQLSTWHHVITQCDALDLITQLKGLPDMQLCEVDLMRARAMLARREAIAFVSMDEGSVVALCVSTDAPQQRTELLHKLVDLYEGCAKVQRTTNDNIMDVRTTFPDASAIVVFPRYEPAEIIDLVRSGQKVPAGITRHVLPLRALRLNYPMDILRSALPLSQKQAHLSEWIYDRVQNRQVRTYNEPTVLFDE